MTADDNRSVPVPPIPLGVEYHRVLAGEKRRIGRGILAIVLLLAGLGVSSAVFILGAAAIDRAMDVVPIGTQSPLFHAAEMVSVALLIPWSMVIQRWLYGVRVPTLTSVVSSFRFDLFGRALMVVAPLWVVVAVVDHFVLVSGPAVWSPAGVLGGVAVTLVLTPLQSAGEEFGFRGLILRVAGGWARGPRVGLVLGVAVSSIVFTVIHASAEPWMNVMYLTFAIGTALVTWRTGGLEVGIVLHALNNTLLFVFAAATRTDLGLAPLNPTVVSVLAPCLGVVVVTAAVWWTTRPTGPALTRGSISPAPQARLARADA